MLAVALRHSFVGGAASGVVALQAASYLIHEFAMVVSEGVKAGSLGHTLHFEFGPPFA
jgi:hypothetical protein